jgi:hypothetical protein
MKRIFFAATVFALFAPLSGKSQDAATEERLKQLSGKIEDLLAGQDAQRKQIAKLAAEVESFREQQSRPNTSYAAQEDLKRLAKAIEEVDRKRVEDSEKTSATLDRIKKSLETSMKPPKNTDVQHTDRDHGSAGSGKSDKPPASDKGFGEYTIQPGDTISAIIAAYKEKGIKLTEKQIRDANPGLVPEKMKVGNKIWIPAPDK